MMASLVSRRAGAEDTKSLVTLSTWYFARTAAGRASIMM